MEKMYMVLKMKSNSIAFQGLDSLIFRMKTSIHFQGFGFVFLFYF